MAPSIGFEKVTTIAFLPMMLYTAFNMFTQKLRYDKNAVYVILLAAVIIVFKWSIDQDYFKIVANFMIIPMLISICFDNLTLKELNLVRRMTIIFFVVECGLSIVEWILNYNFFTYEEILTFVEGQLKYFGFFRSTSLLGHPLANAQVVAVIMTFIATYGFRKKYFQIILFFLGYVSLFCFNARGATLVVTVFTVPYFLWKINKTTQPSRKWMIKLGVFCMFFGMIYLVTQTPMGGRLMNMKLMDDSAQTRLEIFQFYNYYQTNDDFLWGNPNNTDYMINKLGVGGIENGIIRSILAYGIILTIPMLLLLFNFQYRKLSVFSKLDKWLLLAVFYLIGTMNPNLVAPIQWTLWIFAYYTFRPEALPPKTMNTISL